MLVSEKEHTERSSQLPIEEIYTNHDINPNLAYDKTTGYNFDFPSRWANADSTNKVIGLRKLDIIPSAHSFTIGLKVWNTRPNVPDREGWNEWNLYKAYTSKYKPPLFHVGSYTAPPHYIDDNPGFHEEEEFEVEAIHRTGTTEIIGYTCKAIKAKLYQYTYSYSIRDGNYNTTIYRRETIEPIEAEWVQSLYKCFSITEDNSLIEIIHLITQELCPFTSWHSSKLHYYYDNNRGSLAFELIVSGNKLVPFEFIFPTDEDAVQFLHFLNQEATQENKYEMASYEKEHLFYQDVWDRKHVHFHSTFSDSKRGYLGKNKDDLSHVNKLFKYSHGNTSFNIRFTTDGLNNFLPKYCNFVIELVFILNYKKNVIT